MEGAHDRNEAADKTETARRYRVFIASPGDVKPERERAREVVGDLSHRLGTRGGFVLEAVGWESHAPLGTGRPQALVNPLVREADVFVGIMWARFGTETGEAESGTLEEFDLACRLSEERQGRPRVLMFFSDAPVPREILRTPEGREQFEKAERFRKEYEGRGLASTYESLADFERKLRGALEQWCAEHFGFERHPPAAGADRAALEEDYRRRIADHHRHLQAIGFETRLALPVPLERIYVPTRARVDGLGTREESAVSSDFRDTWKIGLDRGLRLAVILGQPGSGKTTLLKHLALLAAEGRGEEIGLEPGTLPVFVPLRLVTAAAGADGSARLLPAGPTLLRASDPSLEDLPASFLDSPLEKGQCLVLLDALAPACP